MPRSHKELRYHTNKTEISIPSLRIAMIQRQNHINNELQDYKKVIKGAEKQFYDILTAKSDNKTKTTWNIIENETGGMHSIEQVLSTLVNMRKQKINEQWQMPSINFL